MMTSEVTTAGRLNTFMAIKRRLKKTKKIANHLTVCVKASLTTCDLPLIDLIPMGFFCTENILYEAELTRPLSPSNRLGSVQTVYTLFIYL